MLKGFVGMMLILFIVASLLIGQTIYKSDLEEQEKTDIYNLTESIKIDFNCSYLYNSELEFPRKDVDRFGRIVCSFSNFLIISALESLKWGVEFGYENPQYDFEFYFKLIRLWIIMLIISLVVSVIIPLGVIVYLSYLGIKVLIIKFIKIKETKDKEVREHEK